jgi:hypothetical protein
VGNRRPHTEEEEDEYKIPPRNAACRDFLLGILIFKELTARRIYKSFGVKGLMK